VCRPLGLNVNKLVKFAFEEKTAARFAGIVVLINFSNMPFFSLPALRKASKNFLIG